MPDKTHFDLETLILLIIAILNPIIAVFMMKGCGIELVFCLFLFILFLPLSWIHAFFLTADRHKRKKSGQLIIVGSSAKPSSGSNVVQLQRTSTAPPPVVQTIEYRPQPVLPAPAPAPAPAPVSAPASPAKATEQVVVVTKALDAPTPVVVPVPAAK